MKENNSLSKFFSHPNYFLSDHLHNVSILIIELIKNIPLNEELIQKDIFKSFAYFIGIFHDYGKFTSYFQEHLSGKELSRREKRYSHHSMISALIGNECIENFLLKKLVDVEKFNDDLKNILLLIAYISIRRHHSNLYDFSIEFDDSIANNIEEWNLIPNQLKDIRSSEHFNEIVAFYSNEILNALMYVEQIKKKLENPKIIEKERREIKNELEKIFKKFDSINEIFKKINRLKNTFNKIKRDLFYKKEETNNIQEQINCLKFFFLNQLVFSLLIDADKRIAAEINKELMIRKRISANIVDEFKAINFDKPEKGTLNELREKFYNDIVSYFKRVKELDDFKNNIFSITAPTGIGKTLAVLSFALKLRKFISETRKKKNSEISPPRIMYALPFTSIIDQNSSITQSIMKSFIKDYNSNEHHYIITHHHLAELKYIHQSEYISNDQALLMIESWESEIIFTTFYQFFHTLFGFKNSQLKKFHNLLNAILIFDEIQAFPPQYWYLLRICLLFLSKYFNTKIIFLTATQPAIFEKNEIIEIIANPNYYFNNKLLDRIELSYDKNSQFIDSMLSKIKDFQLKHNSYIFVFNTIKSSIEAFNYIKDKFQNLVPINEFLNKIEENNGNGFKYEYNEEKIQNNYVLIYLSTNIFPLMRKKRINFIKILQKKKKKFIVITTQLIEAGVDIDAEFVVRDLGPLDSIIQVAGRCNRNNLLDPSKQKKGIVKIFQLINNKNRLYGEYIYNPDLLTKTKEILEKKGHHNNMNNTNIMDNNFILKEGQFHLLAQEYFSLLSRQYAYTSDYFKILMNNKYQPESSLTRKKKRMKKIDYLSDFHLIQQKVYTVDIFINYDSNSQEILNRFFYLLEKIKKNKDKTNFFEAYLGLKNIRKEMSQYIISVPKRNLEFYQKEGIIELNDYNLYIPKKDKISLIFDEMIGFLREKNF
ncbi:MAG: CRISPR-associated endonuclease Cas3'' [Promethearchaeota archaeon]